MRGWWGLAALLAMPSLAVAAEPALGQPQVITNPDWLERPSQDMLADHYPKLAAALEIAGLAQISCEVTDKGRLEKCKVDSEGPTAFGFGRAALAMSSAFLMRPQTVDGKAVPGGVVCIPIRFVFPATTPAPPAQTASRKVRAEALSIVEPQAIAVEKGWEDQLREFLADTSPDADTAARQAVAAAVRASATRHAARLRRDLADVVIATLSPEEIEALSAVTAATSGSATPARPKMPDIAPEVTSRVSAYLFQEIRAAFCGSNPCRGTPAELEAVAAAAGGNTVEVTRWEQAPSLLTLLSATPLAANILGVSGRARLTCTASPDGILETCIVAAEAPAGWKYGEAAIGLSKRYRLEPATGDRSVALRVNFTPMPVIPPDAPPTATSVGAKAMARKLVERSDPQAIVSARLPSMISTLTREVDSAVAPKAEAAIRAGMPRAVDRLIDDLASFIAAEYDEAALVAMVAFQSSPAGKSASMKGPALEASIVAAVRRHQAFVASEARAAFCAGRDCAAPQALVAASPDASTRKP